MHTLKQLKSGELAKQGLTRLQLSENISEFPLEILSLADTLEILDLSNNKLSELPESFAQLQNLKILFLSFNEFTQFPSVIAQCPNLQMIGFKANNITELPENSLPLGTRWLILTDNKIQSLPESIGQLTQLRKLALAGNCLTHLPASMKNCTKLELMRISANRLNTIPDWLFKLPKLAWLAFSGNPVTQSDNSIQNNVLRANMDDIHLGEQLGQGASGVIYRADWQSPPNGDIAALSKPVAVKVFRGEVTSDGYPQDELHCCLAAGEHPNLIKTLAYIAQEQQLALVMELIPARFYNLGLPPSLVTCTRDTFSDDMQLATASVIKVMLSMADALAHLHQHKVSHGDIYAHNTMVDANDNMLFGDFGAATDLQNLSNSQALLMQKIEVRAWGCMLEDLLLQQQVRAKAKNQLQCHVAAESLWALSRDCMQADVQQRPVFTEIKQQLQKMPTNLAN